MGSRMDPQRRPGSGTRLLLSLSELDAVKVNLKGGLEINNKGCDGAFPITTNVLSPHLVSATVRDEGPCSLRAASTWGAGRTINHNTHTPCQVRQ